ncbi:MAG TPA: sugar transferase [Pirellulales bacterium]|nr:sugar transferase [Pirellulales bacterium]
MADSGPSSPAQIAPPIGRPTRRPIYAISKRAFDLLAAGLGLLVLTPAFIVAAIAIALDSRGPVFFLQERMGRNFRPFWIYKFRTMVADADRQGGQLTVGSDPRVTRVGRWLRRTKIDELPQLINVLLGDMSLVGPRPEVPRYVEMFRDEYALVLSVRPGLTDPASVKYSAEAGILAASPDPEHEYIHRILPDKIALARDYVARATFSSDLIVLARTLLRIAR